MNEREALRLAVKSYVNKYYGTYDDNDYELERMYTGILAFINVEMVRMPFTPMVPPVIVEEEKEEDESNS